MSLVMRSDLSAAFRTAAAETLIFLLLVLLNPFEIVEWSEQRSHDVWQRVYAPSYDPTAGGKKAGPPARGTAYGRNRITVVYTDDNTLKALRQTRPISAFALSDMIDDVLMAGGDNAAPRAIFVDFLLTYAAPEGRTAAQLVAEIPALRQACGERRSDGPELSPFHCLLVRAAAITHYDQWRSSPHCRDSTLATILCIRRTGGTPLIFADPRPGSEKPASAKVESAGLDALGRVAVTTPVAFHERRYPMVDPARAGDREHKRFSLYPAPALYAAYCGEGRSRCDPNPIVWDDQRLPGWSKRYERQLDVIWGIGAKSDFTRMIDARGTPDQRCEPASPGKIASLALLIRLLVSGVNLPAGSPCVYTDAIPYEIFQSQVSQKELAALLADRLVLIGGQFSDSNDIVPAPPFGSLPGIYYHAMALDNLIQRGEHYPKVAVPIVPLLDATWTDLANLLAVGLVGFALALAGRILARRQREDWKSVRDMGDDLAKRILISLIFALFLIIILITMAGSARLIPESFNVVAVTLVCLFGLARLAWTASQPVRVLLYRNSAFVRFLGELFAPPEHDAPASEAALATGGEANEGADAHPGDAGRGPGPDHQAPA